MKSMFKLVRQLIDIPSVTGEEGPVGLFIAEHLDDAGFFPTLQEVEKGRFNIYAKARQGPDPQIIFCTHLDTVPPFYPSSEDESHIHGRGACDAKGIIAAMIVAAERLKTEGLGAVALLFVVGEELDSFGAKFANRLEIGSRYVVVGEPTGNQLAVGHKGSFKFVLRAKGKSAHSAYPEQGDSAVERLIDTLNRIRSEDWGRSGVLGSATVNIGTLAGGVAANVVPAAAEARIHVRVVGEVSVVQSKLERLLGDDPNLSYEVISKNDAVFCKTLPGFETVSVSFGTDIPSLENFGEPLLVGPGAVEDAHTDQEKIGKGELRKSVEIYCRVVETLLSQNRG
jgi:acetylornithine deacetylase